VRLKDALKGLLEMARLGNRFFNSREPWRDIKENRARANSTVLASYNLLRAMACYMHIFMPFSAEKLWRMMGLPGEPSPLPEAFDLITGTELGDVEPLFHKVDKEELKKRLREIRERGEVLSARE